MQTPAADPVTIGGGVPDAHPASPRDLLVRYARRMVEDGFEVEVQATVLVKSIGSSVALHAVAAAGLGLLWMVLPLTSSVLLLLVVWSALREADGRRGWLGTFIPRSAGHNLVVWAHHDRPRQVVLVAPLDGPHRSRWADTRWFVPVLAGALLSAVGMALATVAPAVGADVVGAGVIVSLVAALIGAVAVFAYDNPPEVAAGGILELTRRLRDAPLRHFAVHACLTQGGSVQHDGVYTLVRNNPHRLPADGTRVVVLQPSAADDAVVVSEGLIHKRAANATLVQVARACGYAETTGVTGAARLHPVARGVALVGPDLGIDRLEAMLRRMDEDLGEGP